MIHIFFSINPLCGIILWNVDFFSENGFQILGKLQLFSKKCICVLIAISCILSGCSGSVRGIISNNTGSPSPAGLITDYKDDPNISKQEKAVIRVGVFRGEDYSYWNDELKSMASELYQNGVITGYQARNYPNMDETWDALCKCAGLSVRGRLEFVPEYLFTYDRMNALELSDMLAIDDIDLMLTFGTAAGRFLTDNADKIGYDYMVFGATNTVASGIVKSETERFNDHSFALVDTTETERLIRAVYDICPFENIGVVYEDNQDAYIYSGVGDLDRLSSELGFTVHKECVDEAKEDASEEERDKHYEELTAAYERLMPVIDTLFVSTGSIVDNDSIEALLEGMYEHGIITVTQESEEQCESGCMMYFMVTNAEDDGVFMAQTMEEYYAGVPITELEQVFITEPKLFLNYEAIKKTGTKLPMKAYMTADTIYTAEGVR